MAGPVTITCPICRTAFPVPTEVVRVDEANNTALVRMDRSGLHGHMQECAAAAGDKAGAELVNGEPTKAVALPPLAQPHDLPPIPNGRRTCVMCGVENAECMATTRDNRKGCCGACDDGNTHPAPQDTVPCQVWAAEQNR